MSDPRLRDIFDQDAERYERARPRYPASLIEDLVRVTGAGPGVRVLEIAPGTGKLTVDLAGSGCSITAVEIGPSMAAVARRHLAAFPEVEVVVAAFEEWGLPPEPFDAVVCATAFHWLDPDVRMPKAARALRPGGLFGVVATHHVAGGTEDFFAEVQECYERWDPATPPGLRQTRESDLATDLTEFTGSPTSPASPYAATPRRSRTPPISTWTCCSPTRTTARSRKPPGTGCSRASGN